jgi:hypothetical protein
MRRADGERLFDTRGRGFEEGAGFLHGAVVAGQGSQAGLGHSEVDEVADGQWPLGGSIHVLRA